MVPLDLLSQGTISLLSWVGKLLQRLYEVYSTVAAPERRSAVVLIDEVDAHMHPEWQRVLPAILQRRFPRVQVIATTHSPLVVGNLAVGRTIVLRKRGRSVVAERMAMSMKGWTADEILTSPGFDLETPRDPETETMQDEYTRLFAKSPRTPEEDSRLADLAKRLEPRILQRLAAKGRAMALFEQWLEERWLELPERERARVLREARMYMAQLEGARGEESAS